MSASWVSGLDIFVIGDINESRVRKAISDRIKIRTLKKKSDSHFVSMKRTRIFPKKVIEDMNIKQSQLALGYKFDKTSDFEKRYVLNVLSYILGVIMKNIIFNCF